MKSASLKRLLSSLGVGKTASVAIVIVTTCLLFFLGGCSSIGDSDFICKIVSTDLCNTISDILSDGDVTPSEPSSTK